MDVPWIFIIIRSTVSLTRMCPTVDLNGESGSVFALAELLNLQEIGHFPDETVKIGGVRIRSVVVQTY